MRFSGRPVANGAQKWLRATSIFDYSASSPHGDSKYLRSCNILDAAKINGMLINISEVLSWLYRIYVNHKSCVRDYCKKRYQTVSEAISIGSIHCIFNQQHRRSTCNHGHYYIYWTASFARAMRCASGGVCVSCLGLTVCIVYFRSHLEQHGA